MQGEEDCTYNVKGRKSKNTKQHYIESLTTREISMLSKVAWDVLKPKYDHPAPTVAIKWKSPDAKIFTSRKTAWEYATHLSKQEVIIERNLSGLGASGKLLKEFVPSTKTALEVGKLRFVRDGLWVVGQETSWQADREEDLLAQEEELEEAAASKVYTSGLQLYVAQNRHEYREEHGTNLTQADKALRHQWRCLPPKEQEVWNEKVQEQFEDSSEEESDAESDAEEENENKPANITVDGSDEDDNDECDESSEEYVISHYQYFVQERRHDYRHQQQMKLEADDSCEKKKFTLAQADKELRQQWKEMDEQQQDDWIAKLKQMEDGMETEEEHEGISKTENKTGATIEGEAAAITTGEIATGSKITKISIVDKVNSGDQVITESTLTTTKGKEENNGKDQKPQVSSSSIGFEEEKKTEEDDYDAKQSQSMSMDPAKKHTIPESVDSNASIPSPVKVTTANKTKVKSNGKKKSSKMKNTSETKVEATKQAKKKKPTRQPATSKYCLKPKQINLCYDACMEHYETVMRTVKNRDLSRELADGFDVLRERGHGRFDMEIPAFETPEYDFLNTFEKTSWMPIVRSILGEDVVLIHKGAFMSLPGAGAQVYHQDGVHLTTQTQRPCHAINVFVPLVDLHSRNGPTEFVLGSHVLGHDGYDRDFLETPKPNAGTPVVFDYRLGHRGMANSSQDCRPIVYCTYARASDGKAFRDSVNFSRKRYHKIGDLSAKPMSREERRNKRKRSIESALEKEEIEKATQVSVVTGVEYLEAETIDALKSVSVTDESPEVEAVVDPSKSSEMATDGSPKAEGELDDDKRPETSPLADDAATEDQVKVEKKKADSIANEGDDSSD
jgi:hypothetical protein